MRSLLEREGGGVAERKKVETQKTQKEQKRKTGKVLAAPGKQK